MKTLSILPIALSLILPLAAHAQPLADGIDTDVRQSLADAHREASAELANARRSLETENLRLDEGIQFGKHRNGKHATASTNMHRAEITPQGDFLIDGKAQVIDATQRSRLLAYRGLVLEIARTGIDIGQHATDAVFKNVDGNWVGLFFSALTGNLERQVERTVRQEIEPGVRGICRMLPSVMASQKRLASGLPQFQPYATLEQADIDDCENDLRSDFASL